MIGLEDKLNNIFNVAEHSLLKRMNSAMVAMNQFETEIVTN